MPKHFCINGTQRLVNNFCYMYMKSVSEFEFDSCLPVAGLPTNPTFFIDAANIFTDMYFINIHQDFCNIQYNYQFCFDEVTRLCLK